MFIYIKMAFFMGNWSMTVERNKTATKQILDIIFVLTLGVGCAFILAMGTLYYFGPTGSYKAGNVLLSPEVSSKLANYDTRVEYLYFNEDKREWRRVQIGQEAYKKFYDFISEEGSIVIVPEHIIALFNKSDPAIITVFMKKTAESSKEQEASFQEVQILRYDDYYRIQIHDQSEGRNWAYYYHEGMYEESQKLLLSEDEK